MKPATFKPVATIFAAMTMGATPAASSEQPQKLSQADLATCLTEGVTAFSRETLVQVGLDENMKVVSVTGYISPNNGITLSVSFDEVQKLDVLTAHSFTANGSKATMRAVLYDFSDTGDLIEPATGVSAIDAGERAAAALDAVAGCMQNKSPELLVSMPQ